MTTSSRRKKSISDSFKGLAVSRLVPIKEQHPHQIQDQEQTQNEGQYKGRGNKTCSSREKAKEGRGGREVVTEDSNRVMSPVLQSIRGLLFTLLVVTVFSVVILLTLPSVSIVYEVNDSERRFHVTLLESNFSRNFIAPN
jgi:type IV secretory pathway component VirB8